MLRSRSKTFLVLVDFFFNENQSGISTRVTGNRIDALYIAICMCVMHNTTLVVWLCDG